jgi:hypothetical protein
MRSSALILMFVLCACGSASQSPATPPSPAPAETPASTTPPANGTACAVGQPSSGICGPIVRVGGRELCFRSEVAACACACAESGKSPSACALAEETFPLLVSCDV